MTKIKMLTRDGVTLKTEGKYCAEDIYVELGDEIVEELDSIDGLNAEITELNGELADVNAKNEEITKENNNLKEAMGFIDEVVAEKNNKITELETDVAQLETQIDIENKQLGALNEIKYPQNLSEGYQLWYLNEKLDSIPPSRLVDFHFTIEGKTQYVKGFGYYSTSPSWLCYYKTTDLYNDFYIAYELEAWNSEDYRTITITGDIDVELGAWLNANAVRLDGAVLNENANAVRDIYESVGQSLVNKYTGYTLSPMQPSEFATKISEYTGDMTGQELNDYLQEYMKNIAAQYEYEGYPFKHMFLLDFTDSENLEAFNGLSSFKYYASDGFTSISGSSDNNIILTDKNAVEMTFEGKTWKIGWFLVLATSNSTNLGAWLPARYTWLGYYLNQPLYESGINLYHFANVTNNLQPYMFSFPKEIRVAYTSISAFMKGFRFNNQSIKLTFPYAGNANLGYIFETGADGITGLKTFEIEGEKYYDLYKTCPAINFYLPKIILKNFRVTSFTPNLRNEEIYGFDMINYTSTFSYITYNSKIANIRILELFNVKINIALANNSYGAKRLTKECLINNIRELVDVGESRTFTIGSINLAKIADVYVRLTGEEEVDATLPKLPFEICKSTDEGAMLITEYATLKNWTIA